MSLDWMQWGDVPTWLASAGTIAATVLAGRGVLLQGQANKLAADDAHQRRLVDVQEARDQIEHQARQVHLVRLWWRGRSQIPLHDEESGEEHFASQHSLNGTVFNGSGAPVRYLQVHILLPENYFNAGSVEKVWPPRTLAPEETLTWTHGLLVAPSMPLDEAEDDGRSQRFGEQPTAWITFQDADGRTWKRSMAGRLEALEELPE